MRWIRRRAGYLLHPIFRSRALRLLSELEPPRAVLFVCQGNIYRSPFAEHLFRKLADGCLPVSIQVTSAGFVGPDRQAPEAAVALARSRGIELGDHRSARIDLRGIAEDVLVVVMEPRQARMLRSRTSNGAILVLGDLDPLPAFSRTIEDPWAGSEEVLRRSYDRVERCVNELVKALAAGPRTLRTLQPHERTSRR